MVLDAAVIAIAVRTTARISAVLLAANLVIAARRLAAVRRVDRDPEAQPPSPVLRPIGVPTLRAADLATFAAFLVSHTIHFGVRRAPGRRHRRGEHARQRRMGRGIGCRGTLLPRQLDCVPRKVARRPRLGFEVGAPARDWSAAGVLADFLSGVRPTRGNAHVRCAQPGAVVRTYPLSHRGPAGTSAQCGGDDETPRWRQATAGSLTDSVKQGRRKPLLTSVSIRVLSREMPIQPLQGAADYTLVGRPWAVSSCARPCAPGRTGP
jgi:hypothetical protein